jgi:hypothetical protein
MFNFPYIRIEIYYRDDYWSKSIFDKTDDQIYYENSRGYWNKTEYDSNGIIIYYQRSDGYIEDRRNV